MKISKNPTPSAGYCGTCGRKLPPSREVDEEGNICAWNPCEFCNEKAKAQAGFMPQGVVQQALESTQPITCEQHLARLIDANKILKASANYKMVQEQQVRIGKLEAENTDLKRRLRGMEAALRKYDWKDGKNTQQNQGEDSVLGNFGKEVSMKKTGAEQVSEMIKNTMPPEVYDAWLNDKITLLSALMLCLNLKMDKELELFGKPVTLRTGGAGGGGAGGAGGAG